MHAGLSIESLGTLESQYHKGPRDWKNCSLYRGLCFIEICCIEVPLYLLGEQNIIRVISDNIILFFIFLSLGLQRKTLLDILCIFQTVRTKHF